MRKTTICLSILLAVAATTAAQAKKHHHSMRAPAVAKTVGPNGYAWPGTPYPSVATTMDQRSAFIATAVNPMSAK